MINVRNRNQLTFDSTPPWYGYLSEKKVERLKKSWAGIFQSYITPRLPITRIAKHYSERMGRPSKELTTVMGTIVLQQIFDLTEPLRGLIHRIAGTVLIIVSVEHIIEIFITRGGQGLFKAFIPKMNDLKTILQNIKYLFGASKEKPQYDRFDYTEKIEYWALVWGTMVMIITGLILFFPVFFTRNAPPWFFKVSETIHYYEAWLATLAILVWHLFFVLFHPDEYPMSMTWLHGRMSIEEYQHKHPKDFDRIMREVEEYKEGKKN